MNEVLQLDADFLSCVLYEYTLRTVEIERFGGILRDEYDIQTEFGDIANLLAYVSVGDRLKDIERLVSALAEIRRMLLCLVSPEAVQRFFP